VEQGDAKQSRRFESNAQPYGRIASLDLADRRRRGARSVGQLLESLGTLAEARYAESVSRTLGGSAENLTERGLIT
jgi:hypothetical protein